MKKTAVVLVFWYLLGATPSALAQSSRAPAFERTYPELESAKVGYGDDENTPRNRARCALDLVRQVLNQSSFKDLIISSVSGSPVYSLNGKFLIQAHDPNYSAHKFEGWVRVDFDRILPQRDARSGIALGLPRYKCRIPLSEWNNESILFQLRNRAGDSVLEVMGYKRVRNKWVD